MNIIYNIYKIIITRKDLRFKVPIAKQKKIIEKFPEPKDNIERSYFQYKCLCKIMGFKTFIMQVFSILQILLYAITIKGDNKKSDVSNPVDLLCIVDGVSEDIVPKHLIKSYSTVKYYNELTNAILTREDKRFILKIIKRYPISYALIVKIIKAISEYSYIIKKYNPKAIATHGEYHVTSSILTEYCNNNGILHINFMHGEKIFFIRDSFFCYDECYVWNKYYEELFKSLRAKVRKYIIENPFNEVNKIKVLKTSDYCYYMSSENKKNMKNILNILDSIRKNNYKVLVRAHPRWTNIKLLKKLSKKMNIDIEENCININESILSKYNAISLYSTVLWQAINYKTNIIIDDLTDNKKFRILKEAKYICFRYDYKLLSEIIKKV